MTMPSKVWLRFFFIGYIALMLLWVVSLTSPVPYGDLTRIGRLSERDFGWRDVPPKVDPALLVGTPVDKADVLVIGDSFSMTFRWQSALVKAGYKVSTTYWGQYNEEMCADFDDWVQRTGFKGKLIVMESVERLLDARMKSTSECKTQRVAFDAMPHSLIQPDEEVPNGGPNWNVQFMTGIHTYYNTWQAEKSHKDTFFTYNTWVRAVPDGCKYFSHRLCEKMPFFGEDEDNGPLTAVTLSRMKAFTAAHQRIPMLWMVIPNKTTVYLKPDFSKDFEAGLRESKLGPDLYQWTRDERGQIRDFYFSNDTHMSMHGQLALGQRMLEAVRQIVPVPPSRSP